ncbi:hypothetical protein GPECTOR_4g849 [Gonium pectorale]|uniref:Cytochrome P450 n=1 Tax=Gonium pectorale TaxID=33097 RepID=A0A150GY69_GONPE|nr:hypothetical protein GPECTOR_4g849 [Gonium pectorale]|eukprot:KXZ54779.1 hypothetical protein GPECTOR_4g849 [Gonium pectorale]
MPPGYFCGPFGLPFLGNLAQIASSDLTAFLLQTARKYGPVSKFWFGSRPWVLIADAELVRKHANASAVRHPALPSFMHVMTGENREVDQAGLFVTEGEMWRRGRRAFEASIIHPTSLAAHVPAMARCLDRFLPTLERHAASGSAWEARDALAKLILGMVGEIAYGIDFGLSGGGEPTSELGAALADGCRDTFETMMMENATAYLPLQARTGGTGAGD